jgi:hypothetical protein
MFDERKKRSDLRQEALQYLIEAVLDRSDVTCAAIVDARNRLVAGAGDAEGLRSLGRVANDVARGDASVLAEGPDVLACAVDVKGETLVIAAIGTRIRRMPGAAKAVARICESTRAVGW